MPETPEEIRFYRATGKYGFLSNLYRREMMFEGKTFTCSEAAYQHGKPRDPIVADWICSAPKPHLIAMAAHGLFVYDIRGDWNQVKVDRMRQVLLEKFTQHQDLGILLMDTGTAKLTEISNMDAFWGTGKKGTGQNMLGVLLMEIRDQLRYLTCEDLRVNSSGDPLCAFYGFEGCSYPNCHQNPAYDPEKGLKNNA